MALAQEPSGSNLVLVPSESTESLLIGLDGAPVAQMAGGAGGDGVHFTKPGQFQSTVGGLVGNVLVWYDFAVYGALAENVGVAFFSRGCDTGSTGNHTLNATGHAYTTAESAQECASHSLLESFAVFGGAFLMRPLGALVFGYIGDTYGRKKALEASVLMMAAATFAMGVLPTYEQAGVIAPLLLIAVRLFQGVSVGGELIGSLVYTTETAPPERWGLYSSLSLMTAVLGTTLGMAVGAIMHSAFTTEELNTWAWRIPFLCGILLGGSAIWIRRGLVESEEFEKAKADDSLSKTPLKDAVTKHLVPTIIVFFVVYVYTLFLSLSLSPPPLSLSVCPSVSLSLSPPLHPPHINTSRIRERRSGARV